jgi:hypothetical protein
VLFDAPALFVSSRNICLMPFERQSTLFTISRFSTSKEIVQKSPRAGVFQRV